jgi:hypothetical protein
MRTARRGATWFAAVLVVLGAACKSGESQGGAGGFGGGGSSSGGDGGGVAGADGSGGSGGVDGCGTCAQAFTDGLVPCGGTAASDAYDALLDCACGACGGACSGSLCASGPADATCADCLGTGCAALTMTCSVE